MSHHKPRTGIDRFQEDDGFLLVLDVDDHAPEDVDCRWEDGRLVVHAEAPTGADGDETFHRSIRVPRPVRCDDIEASLEDDVLEIWLPIGEGRPDGHEVEVRAR